MEVTVQKLAKIVSDLMTATESTGELDGYETFAGFATEVAQVVCDYCGGEIKNPAAMNSEGVWSIGVIPNDCLPNAFGGIWRESGIESEEVGTAARYERRLGTEHPDWAFEEWKTDVFTGSTKLGYWDWVAHNADDEDWVAYRRAGNVATVSEEGVQ